MELNLNLKTLPNITPNRFKIVAKNSAPVSKPVIPAETEIEWIYSTKLSIPSLSVLSTTQLKVVARETSATQCKIWVGNTHKLTVNLINKEAIIQIGLLGVENLDTYTLYAAAISDNIYWSESDKASITSEEILVAPYDVPSAPIVNEISNNIASINIFDGSNERNFANEYYITDTTGQVLVTIPSVAAVV